ncbi:MAG: site-2 protease family protein [Candidatus Thorarchaeota archaeon]|jgi:Zn-dependent protease
MANCSLCGKEDLSFTCHYCNGVFCSDHRLPESHGCPGIHLAKDDASKRIEQAFTGSLEFDEESEPSEQQRQDRRKPKKKRFSRKETRDLAIATILVALVGLSMMGFPYGIWAVFQQLSGYVAVGLWWFPLATIGIFIATFMVHEMAHKFTAQHYGMWSEFRMTSTGYYLSFVAILLSFPIFGTGVVYTSRARNEDENARANLAGPFSNLIIALILGTLIFVIAGLNGGTLAGVDTSTFFLVTMLRYGLILNSMLGLFNMIPFQPFDGGTVFTWNRRIWAIITVSLLGLLIFGYIGISLL